jgi:uncharacterized protein YndB with AHSA1/START domain
VPTSIATIEIEAPAADVYRYLTTPRLLSEWIGGLLSHTPLGGAGELRLGARGWDKARDGGSDVELESEVVAFEPDRSLNVRIESKGFKVMTDFHLFESAGRTTVRQSVRLSYKRWHKMFAPITGRSVQKRIDGDLARLKKKVETAMERKRLKESA